MISSYWLSMISGQTLRVCPEGKPAPTFPDHALRRNHQIDRLGAFALLVRFDLECDALSFDQILQPRPLNRGDMNEHIAAAVIGFDEAIATFSVEELDRTSHGHRENSYPVVLRRYARRVPARPDIRCRKAWPSGRIKPIADPPLKYVRPCHSAATIRGSGT